MLRETLQKFWSGSAAPANLDADVITFPDLALTGYPPEDLLLKPQFIDANLAALEKVIAQTRDIVAVAAVSIRH